jgi:hypothetical protein
VPFSLRFLLSFHYFTFFPLSSPPTPLHSYLSIQILYVVPFPFSFFFSSFLFPSLCPSRLKSHFNSRFQADSLPTYFSSSLSSSFAPPSHFPLPLSASIFQFISQLASLVNALCTEHRRGPCRISQLRPAGVRSASHASWEVFNAQEIPPEKLAVTPTSAVTAFGAGCSKGRFGSLANCTREYFLQRCVVKARALMVFFQLCSPVCIYLLIIYFSYTLAGILRYAVF